jgi:hypothetical protein
MEYACTFQQPFFFLTDLICTRVLPLITYG